MNIITISREFGSGGRELGKRLADIKGYDYYDSEIIAAVAKKSGMDEAYIENTLSNHGWRNQAITFRGTLASSAYVKSSKVQLPERKEAISGIAQMGKDCVIVGRNADVILREYEPLNIFVCASAEAKPKRCTERASAGGNLSEKELLRRMKRIDGVRRQTRELMTGSQWGQRDAYQLIVNTTQWEIKQLAQAVAYLADCRFGRKR